MYYTMSQTSQILSLVSGLPVYEKRPKVIKEYFENLSNNVKKILDRPTKEFSIDDLDILDSQDESTIEVERKILHRQQIKMKYGEIWEMAMGSFPGWEHLGTGHETGLDIRRIDNSCIVEVKNKYNTCNSSMKNDIRRKLDEYKQNNPDCMCLLGMVNPNHKTKINKRYNEFNYKDYIISEWQGSGFLSYVFTYEGFDYSNEVVEELRSIVHG